MEHGSFEVISQFSRPVAARKNYLHHSAKFFNRDIRGIPEAHTRNQIFVRWDRIEAHSRPTRSTMAFHSSTCFSYHNNYNHYSFPIGMLKLGGHSSSMLIKHGSRCNKRYEDFVKINQDERIILGAQGLSRQQPTRRPPMTSELETGSSGWID